MVRSSLTPPLFIYCSAAGCLWKSRSLSPGPVLGDDPSGQGERIEWCRSFWGPQPRCLPLAITEIHGLSPPLQPTVDRLVPCALAGSALAAGDLVQDVPFRLHPYVGVAREHGETCLAMLMLTSLPTPVLACHR